VFGPFKTLVFAAVHLSSRSSGSRRRVAINRILRRGWATDLGTGVINGLLLSAVVLILLAVVESTANAAVPNVRVWVASTPLWAQAIVAVVIGDFRDLRDAPTGAHAAVAVALP